MKKYTDKELSQMIKIDGDKCRGATLEYDDIGQMIIYTGLFLWNDGSVRDTFQKKTRKKVIRSH